MSRAITVSPRKKSEATSMPDTNVPISTDYDAVVVGAGFSGLYMLHKLRELGLSVRVIEMADGVGGTWFWNRYPGARCDSESYYYCFTFSKEILLEWEWTSRYPEQPEILRYLNYIADKLDLRGDIQFSTRVTAARYDEPRGKWIIETDRGDHLTVTYFITAVGCLSSAQTPDFKGHETFRGKSYHTGQWPHEGVDFIDKRVGIIGTGSTGIQAIPVIAKHAKHLTVFQRTPNYTVPARDMPMPPEFKRDVKARYDEVVQKTRESVFGMPFDFPTRSALEVAPGERDRVYEELWNRGGFCFMLSSFHDLITDQEANDTAAEYVRRKIREIVKDPETARKLSPYNHPIGTKRPPIDTDYYETFNRENVTLIDIRNEPIEEITPDGIRTSKQEYRVDAIVYATGFDAMTGSLFQLNIRGRGGMLLQEKWADGPHTYLGIATADFPNMFMITGPGSPSVLSNMPVSIEQHVEWIAACLGYMRSRGLNQVEPLREAERAWDAHVAETAAATLFPRADSWYMGANIPGKPRVFFPYAGGVGAYRQRCAEIAANSYEGFVLGQHQDRVAAQ
jgi:cation diffusion facilitator CzcD-associated flavoprotein CzcO